MRMWENMANGSCCFSQRTEIEFIYKPSDMIHYVEYSNMEEFEKKIRKMLNDKDACIQIGKKGLEFVKEFHTGKARFQYILGKIKEKSHEK
jgi:spore maturation protein CgeB